MKFSKELTKARCQRCYSYIEAGFEVCPCGGKLNISEEMLSCIGQTFKQLTADADMTFQETTRAIVSMNKEAGQNPQIISRRYKCRDDLDSEKLKWLIWSTHNWKWYFGVKRNSDLNSTQRHHRESDEEHASGSREALTHTSDDWWKGNWWTKSLWERSRWSWSDDCCFFFP